MAIAMAGRPTSREKLGFDKTTSVASDSVSRGVTRAMSRHGSRSAIRDAPFDVNDFEFFKMWKQRPAVRKLVEEEAALRARRAKVEEQRREEARLEACGWQQLHLALRMRGLPDLGTQQDLARRLFAALQAEARGEDPAVLFAAREDRPPRPVSRAQSAPGFGRRPSSQQTSHGSSKRPQSASATAYRPPRPGQRSMKHDLSVGDLHKCPKCREAGIRPN